MLTDNIKFLEKLFDDTFTYTTKATSVDPVTKRTVTSDVTSKSYNGRLCFVTIKPTETNGLTTVTQSVKLFTYKDISIPDGSSIEVIHKGETTLYQQSGKPALYKSHQEIPVELWRVKA